MTVYLNKSWDRHGIPRNVPAADWPCKHARYSQLERGLAASLVPYVSGDDATMSRIEFLETVIARIEQDLLARDI